MPVAYFGTKLLIASAILAACTGCSTPSPEQPSARESRTWSASKSELRPETVERWRIERTDAHDLRWSALDSSGAVVISARMHPFSTANGAIVIEDEIDPSVRLEIGPGGVVANTLETDGFYMKQLIAFSALDLLALRQAAGVKNDGPRPLDEALTPGGGSLVGDGGDALLADGQMSLLCGGTTNEMVATTSTMLSTPSCEGASCNSGGVAAASVRVLDDALAKDGSSQCLTAFGLPAPQCVWAGASGGALVFGGGCAGIAFVLNNVSIVGWGATPIEGGACVISAVGGTVWGTLAALFNAGSIPACQSQPTGAPGGQVLRWQPSDYTAQGIEPSVAKSLANAGRCDPGEYLRRAALVHGPSSLCEQPRSCESWAKPGAPLTPEICGTMRERARRNYDCLKARQDRDWCFADQPDAQRDEHRAQKAAAESSAAACRSIYMRRCTNSSGY